jgi:hypothetical protein
MQIWYTWLAYFGLVFGLIASWFMGTSLARSAAVGFVVGIVIVVLVNVASPTPAPCLQSSKGWEILRAYRMC